MRTPHGTRNAIPPLPDREELAGRSDPIDPHHYRAHPSGVECIDVTEHMGFCLGNAVKYIWRVGLKGDAIEDLKKARWYLDREIARLEREEKLERYRGTK